MSGRVPVYNDKAEPVKSSIDMRSLRVYNLFDVFVSVFNMKGVVPDANRILRKGRRRSKPH